MDIKKDYPRLKAFIATATADIIHEGDYDMAEVHEWKGEVGQKSVDFYLTHARDPQMPKYHKMLCSVISEEEKRLVFKFKPTNLESSITVYEDQASLVGVE
jgi:hypothetical protein